MSEERIQKVLARAGVAARRKVEEMIREGRVSVNGELATIGQKVDLTEDAIKVDGHLVEALKRPPTRLLVNKPTGVVSTVSDPEGRPVVIDLVPIGIRRGLVPVGRLDFDSEGLILLTDDGDLAQKVAHPRYGCHKHYEVKVRGVPSEQALDRLRGGIRLEGKPTAPVGIEPLKGRRGRRVAEANSWWAVELQEGKTRQIREIFQRIGHPVMRLRRVGIGGVRDPRLTPGSWRHLEEGEVERLLSKKTRKGSGGKTAAWSEASKSSEGSKKKGDGKSGSGKKAGWAARREDKGKSRGKTGGASGGRGRSGRASSTRGKSSGAGKPKGRPGKPGKRGGR